MVWVFIVLCTSTKILLSVSATSMMIPPIMLDPDGGAE